MFGYLKHAGEKSYELTLTDDSFLDIKSLSDL